ncbi:hypothetical protein [Agrobacterium sp. NPDC089420]|uniref:hypothetical protein n=1 Tax=Agrobacterium sp. NPDC089420 TaxID=3363918 RepID=UPI00384DF5B1
MKTTITATVLALAISACGSSAQQPAKTDILDVSAFLMPPRQSWAKIPGSRDPNVTISERTASSGDMGFRVLHLRAAVKAKKQAAIDLAQSGLVETGDILLSFRPLWDRTLAYAHMQLGISHSAMAFIVSQGNDRFVMTLESPISYSSPLNAPEHYADLDSIHILRPALTDGQKTNLEKWARLVLSHPGRFSFFSDYGLPMYKRGRPDITSPRDEILHLAKVATGTASPPFESYCSEFVWSLLGLRDCDPQSFDAACISPAFNTGGGMMSGIVAGLKNDAGLAQGPEAALIGGKITASDKTRTLTQSVFVDIMSDPSELEGRMSAGHRKVAEDNRENMTILNGFYAGGEAEPVAQAINRTVFENVSPTSFLTRSNAGMDGFHYVGTVVFDR